MKITIKNCRIAFANIWKAQQVNGQGDPKFSAAFLIAPDHPQVAAIEAAEKEVAKAKWNTKADSVLKAARASGKQVLKDGDTKSDYAGYEGMLFINTSNPQRPTIVDRDKTPLSEEDGKPYGGCYVNAVIELWAQDNQFGKRVNASLAGIQFVKDGDRFAGGSKAEDTDFEELGDGADADEMV